MSWKDLFFGSAFQRTMKRYCADQGWRIDKLTDDYAILKFTMASRRVQTCFIVKYETTLEFSVPSELRYRDPDEMPHRGSTALLLRSREKRIGFWCIEKANGGYTYSYMHNAEMALIDSDYFARVINALIRECDDFESSLT